MGHHPRSETLFYCFRLEDQVPENHLLRLIDKHISFEFVRQRLKDSYSETGRPSIDPELLLRILLVGCLYGLTSERKLVEELRTPPFLRPARTVSGIEVMRTVVGADRVAMRGSGIGAGSCQSMAAS